MPSRLRTTSREAEVPASYRGILIALPVVVLAAVFWFLLLAPKRDQAAQLEDDVAALEASVSEQEQLAAAAEQAEKDFPRNYRRVVVLGKAVPEDSDTSSLLVQLTRLANESGVDFRGIELVEPATTGAPQATTPSPAAPVQPSVQEPPSGEPTASGGSTETSAAPGASSGTPAAPAEPTEAAAANLPLGATVGPAGLPIMPYELQFHGDFFAIADFIAKVNEMVELDRDGAPSAFGRLITVDGFTLSTPDETGTTSASSAVLEASFAVTTYVTPGDEGATAGATPSGPAAPAGAAPTSATPESPTASAPTASAGASVAGVAP
jgi:Tfp pilus assembly protein PilO